MKQKNLVLMVVAVACGLLAAFLTSQMSAKPAVQTPQIEVLVVAKELPPGTKFTADSIKDQFKKKTVNPEAIPEKAVITEDMLDGKTLNKTLRADDFLRESDLGNYTPLLPPEGRHSVTVRLPVDKMTPFVQPNSRIDLLGTLQNSNDGKIRGAILIPNMLVMAVDTKVVTPQGNAAGEMSIQMATVAATRDEAAAIRLCEHANVKLSFILRSEGGVENPEDKNWSLDKVVAWVNADNAQTKSETETPKDPKTEDTAPTLKMTVPTADLPAGTELTSDVVQSKFKEVPVIGAPPANAVLNIKEHVGRFLVKDIATDQFVPKSFVADKLPEVAKAAPSEQPTPKTTPEIPDATPAKKLKTFDRSYTTPAGTKVYRYEIQESGELRFMGEVTGDGAVIPAAPNETPEKKVS